LFDQFPNQIACVLLEPVSFEEPKNDFLGELKKLCEKNGALLIFDEVVSGFRFSLGGAQEMIKVKPHLAAFGKGMGNGFSISALVGLREIMEIGGIKHDSEKVFLLSTTHGGETHSLAAAMATIKEIQKNDGVSHFWKVGKDLQDGVRKILKKHQAEHVMKVFGYPCKPAIVPVDFDGNPSMRSRTLYLQETAARGLLIPYIVPSFAHKTEHVNEALEIIEDAIIVLKNSHEEKNFEKYIEGQIVKPVFRKFN
jgi:glutamate-1-semialdehyde 2,1-aminomutase